jgi:hypothetical protein
LVLSEDIVSFSLYSLGDLKVLEHPSFMFGKSESKTEAFDLTDKLSTINKEHVSIAHCYFICYETTLASV